MAGRVTGLADTRREAPSRTEPSKMAWGKAMAALAVKELYLLGFIELLELAESPCLPSEKPLHLQPQLYRLRSGTAAPQPHRGPPAFCITSLLTH